MSKYAVQLRRGVKNDSRDDWADYEKIEGHIPPQTAELVLEDYYGVPRLKIGDGVHEFSELPYMSIDSFIIPTQASITLDPTKREEVLDENNEPIPNRYNQYVTVDGAVITSNSKIDLQPTPEQVLIFYEKDITFTAINNGGNVRVCVVGQQPTNEYTIQATTTKVIADGEIVGNTTTTPYFMQALIDRIEALENAIANNT